MTTSHQDESSIRPSKVIPQSHWDGVLHDYLLPSRAAPKTSCPSGRPSHVARLCQEIGLWFNPVPWVHGKRVSGSVRVGQGNIMASLLPSGLSTSNAHKEPITIIYI